MGPYPVRCVFPYEEEIWVLTSTERRLSEEDMLNMTMYKLRRWAQKKTTADRLTTDL